MLIVDVNTLLFVYSLNFLEQILVYTLYSVESQYVVRIERSACYLASGVYIIALLDVEPCSVRDNVSSVLFLAADSDLSLVVLTAFDGNDFSVGFADFSDTLWLSCLEKFLYSRETLSDVSSGYAAGMEGSHGQLSTRFTD